MLSKPTISIIGCGWLGLPLAEFLIEKGYPIKGSTTNEAKLSLLKSKGIDSFLFKAFAKWNDNVIAQRNNILKLFQSDILYLNIPPRRRRPDVATLYPQEIKNIIQLAIEGGVQKIVFVSSTGVYPDTNSIVTEETLRSAIRDSGKALIEIENELKNLTTVESTILRMAGLVGEERKAGRFLAGKKEVKNGEAPVNLVHLEDCIRVSYEVIKQEQWGAIFNVVSDEHPTRKAFYTHQAKKENLEPPTFVKQEQPTYKIVSNEKVKRELDYEFKYPNPMDFP